MKHLTFLGPENILGFIFPKNEYNYFRCHFKNSYLRTTKTAFSRHYDLYLVKMDIIS